MSTPGWGVVASISALEAEGLGFDARQRHDPRNLIYLVTKLLSHNKEIFIYFKY